MAVEQLELAHFGGFGRQLDSRGQTGEGLACSRHGKRAVLDVHEALRMRILTGSRQMHVSLNCAGHVGDLRRQPLYDREADRRGLDLEIDGICRSRFDVLGAATWREKTCRNTALRRDGLGGGLTERRIQTDTSRLVVNVRRE